MPVAWLKLPSCVALLPMDSRESKLRRLDRMRRSLPHVSAKALADILEHVATEGVPERRTRRDIGIARDAQIQQVSPYGELLVSVPVKAGGETKHLLAINPLAMLWLLFHQGGGWTDFMTFLLERKPSSPENPWGMILYSDEVVPGNPLSFDNLRKAWAIYFGSREFGAMALQREESWLDLLAYRSSELKKIDAGISQAFGAVANLFFGGLGPNIATAGITLDHPDGRRFRLFANIFMVLQDGGAHKAIWNCKGEAGTKMCMLCRNLVTRQSGLRDEDGAETLVCDQMFEPELDFANDDDIHDAVRRLATKVGCKDFALISQAAGFRHEPNSILLMDHLRPYVKPVSQFCHDVMHAFFVKGAFNTTMFLLLDVMRRDGINVWDHLRGEVGLWQLPARTMGFATSCRDAFAPKRMRSSLEAKTMKCTASEALTFYPFIAIYLQRVIIPARRCLAACAAFLAMTDLLDHLMATPHAGLITADMLRQDVTLFLDKCITAGWRQHLHPKFHWAVHMPRHYDHFKMLPMCWVHERKHRVLKRYSSLVMNTASFDKTIQSEVLCHQFADLGHPDAFRFDFHLEKPRPASAKLKAMLENELQLQFGAEVVTMSAIAHILPAGVCSKSDVAMVKSAKGSDRYVAVQIWAHAAIDETLVSLVNFLQPLEDLPDLGCAVWRLSTDPKLIATEDILCSVCFCEARAEAIRILLPFQFRGLKPDTD